ncbi:MAG TPA: PHP-associated domain-containing protein, partial [Vicinamibacterales bacterium]|nr:PHP-associated domain-containing protein [Vicinamibacterales bacterium]
LGYQALAITLHERQLDVRPLRAYAADRGITLIPGVERSIEGRHVLLLNFQHGADTLNTFDDLAKLKRTQHGLVVAPHPFYPSKSSVGCRLDAHHELFDAVEFNAMYTRSVDFNRRAVSWAKAHDKPLVGNCDVHRLRQLGTTYSLIDAAPDADAICDAIVAGRIQIESRPLAWNEVACIFPAVVLTGFLPRGHEDQPAIDTSSTPQPSFK